MRKQKLPELLQKLAVAREVACGVFLLHLAEHGARLFKRITACFGFRRGGFGSGGTDEEPFGTGQCARPFDLAVIGQELP